MNLILNKVPTSNFKPSKIPGLVLWLDSTSLAGLADSTPIGTWSDLSGQGNHATQGTAVNKPTKETVTNNGKTFAVARFDGVDDNFANVSNAFAFASGFSIFVIVKATAQVPWGRIVDYSSFPLGNGWFLGWYDTFQQYEWRLQDVGGGGGTVVSGIINLNNFNIAHTFYNKDIEEYGLYVNGFLIDSATTSGAMDYTSVTTLGIGRRLNGDIVGEYFIGDLSHILIYNRALSTSERQRVERWLSKKTGVTLA